jgi:hypothetical protein
MGTAVRAQSEPAAPPNPLAIKKTIVDFEIMLDEEGNPLDPQQWGPVFERLGAAVQFRQRILDDQVSINERIRGSYRMVTAIGELDSNGSLNFPGKSFKLDNTQPLAEWIRELQTYGGQGSPDGQPVWGLTDKQFDALFAELGRPVTGSCDGLEFQSAIEQLGLPAAYPFRLHETARELVLSSAGAHTVRHEINGLSRGTALAIVLADYGLGFRPLRSPAGAIDLVAEPLAGLEKPWPIGWPLEDDRPRNETTPALFAQVDAGFNDVPLADVLSAIEEATSTRVIVDYEKCAGRDIDPAALNVKYPQRKTAWILILRTVAAQARLTREIMVDEAGTPFVYLFPFEPKRARDVKSR